MNIYRVLQAAVFWSSAHFWWYFQFWLNIPHNYFQILSFTLLGIFLFQMNRKFQKQPSSARSSPSEVFLRKRRSENMQQIYRKTTLPKCNFNKVANLLYWNCTLAWVFSCEFITYFQKGLLLSCKKIFWKVSQISQEKILVEVCFLN